MARRGNGNGNGNGRKTMGERMVEVGDKVRGSQAWTAIFRPGSIFRKGYTDSTMRCAAHRCMFRTSQPKATAVCNDWMSFHAWADGGR